MAKKIVIAVIMAICACVSAFARPHGVTGGFHGGFGHRPPPVMHHGGYHHHGPFWGHGGRNFCPGFVGGVSGVIGGALYGGVYRSYSPTVVYPTTTVVSPVVTPAPVVVQQPVVVQTQPTYTTQQVWVREDMLTRFRQMAASFVLGFPGYFEQRTIVP